MSLEKNIEQSIMSLLEEFNNQKYDHNEIISLYQKGITYEKIAKQVECSIGQVGNIILEFKRDKINLVKSNTELGKIITDTKN